MNEEQVVESLSIAKPGDAVWLYEAERSRYVDGKYVGRGVWMLKTIEAETRESFMLASGKFDRKTGNKRPRAGYSSGDKIAGRAEREAHKWIAARYRLSDIINRTTDIDALKQVADIVGFELPKEIEG